MTENEPASVARGFLFADLRNYSAWVERHGDHAAAGLLREYRGVVRQAVAEFDGAEIKTEGDSFYVVFGSPSAAVRCGLQILELAAASQGTGGGPIPVGVGVHAGETVSTDEGYVGSVVNIAARVCAQAAAGELIVTDAVRSLTRTYLDVTFLPRGRKRLKGISEPISLYRVTPAGTGERASRWRWFVGRWPYAAAAVTLALVVVASALIGGAVVRDSRGRPNRVRRDRRVRSRVSRRPRRRHRPPSKRSSQQSRSPSCLSLFRHRIASAASGLTPKPDRSRPRFGRLAARCTAS